MRTSKIGEKTDMRVPETGVRLAARRIAGILWRFTAQRYLGAPAQQLMADCLDKLPTSTRPETRVV